MTDVRRIGNKRLLFDSNSVVAGGGETAIVCINRDIIPIIIEFLSTRGITRTSYFTAVSTQTYTLPDLGTFDSIRDIIAQGVSDLQQGYSMATCDAIVSSLEAIGVTMKEIRDSVNNQSQILAQSQCGCVGQGTNPTPEDQSTPCVVPAGFDDWSDFTTYSCQFVNWFLDKLMIAMEQIRQSYFWLYYDYFPNDENNPISVTQIYQMMAQMEAATFPLEWLYNLGDPTKAGYLTALTDLYLRFRTDKFLRVPETDPVEDVIQDWYDGAMHMREYFDDNYNTIAQDLYDAQNAADFLTEVQNAMSAAETYASGQPTGGTGLSYVCEVMNSIVDVGVAMLGFTKSTIIDAYTVGSYSCTGEKGCCPTVAIVTGQNAGTDTYSSVFKDGFYTVDLVNNAYAPLNTCGVTLEWVIATSVSGTPDSAQFYDDSDVPTISVNWPMASNQCDRRVKWTGAAPFTIVQGTTTCS